MGAHVMALAIMTISESEQGTALKFRKGSLRSALWGPCIKHRDKLLLNKEGFHNENGTAAPDPWAPELLTWSPTRCQLLSCHGFTIT